jgi:histidinol-phosphate aminotransferase
MAAYGTHVNTATEAAEALRSLLVPAAHALPSNAEYLAHLDVAAADRSLIRLASNENTEPPSPRVREALARAYNDANLSPPTVPPLRIALAERYGVAPESVLVGAGSTELIDATMRTFVRAGDEVVLPNPSWPVYRRRLAALEARIVEVPLAADERSYAYDVDALLGAVTRRTKLIVVCTPNNPTGNSMRLDDVRRCAEAGPIVLLDAAYADFDPASDVTSIVKAHGNVVLARTFSKAYCLAGLRVGYVVGDAAVLDHVDRFLVPGTSVSSASLHAALAALEDGDYHRGQVERIVSERERLLAGLRELGVHAYDSRGNFVAVDCPVDSGGARGLASALLGHGIVIRVMDDRLARITVGRAEENDAVLAALEALRAADR